MAGPTILAKRRQTGLRSPGTCAPAPVTTAVEATPRPAAAATSSTPTMTTTSPQRRTCGPRTSMAKPVTPPPRGTTAPMAAAAPGDTPLRPATRMSLAPLAPPRAIPKTRPCATTPASCPRRERGATPAPRGGITRQTTPGTRRATTTARAAPPSPRPLTMGGLPPGSSRTSRATLLLPPGARAALDVGRAPTVGLQVPGDRVLPPSRTGCSQVNAPSCSSSPRPRRHGRQAPSLQAPLLGASSLWARAKPSRVYRRSLVSLVLVRPVASHRQEAHWGNCHQLWHLSQTHPL
ncbi:translation initiation factor IF-2-like [Oncorhynchus keta]|uniref:translation initiation factor IF-2-like n=1 Tax=Oncorhynchus keta TaxID=8018 RepID=UPI00227B0303|nr:translation initiation factor IF-2-like [Oncorhynchus keta]